MNKVLKIMKAGFILALIVSPLAHADTADPLTEHTAADKLGRGALNVISSPIEVARTIDIQSKVKGPAYGWTAGLVEGLGRMVVRLGTGLIEVVTFPFDFPDENKAPLLEPEYPWQKWDVQYL